MKTLIATRYGDKLFVTSRTVRDDGTEIFGGVLELQDGGSITVPNVDVLLARGYWDEIVD